MSFRSKFIAASSIACILLIVTSYYTIFYPTFWTHALLIFLTFTTLMILFSFFYRTSDENNLEFKKTLMKNARLRTKRMKGPSVKEEIESHRITRADDNMLPHAHYDQITALPSYTFCLHILEKFIDQAKRHKRVFALLLIDLDHFKKINFNMGRNFGDQVLKQIGNRITNTLRSEDTTARYTGDRFIVLLNDIGKPKFASTVAVKLLNAISQPIRGEIAGSINTTASIGICIFPDDGNSVSNLLNNIEKATLEATNAGGNNYKFYSKVLEGEAREFVTVSEELRNALQNHEFELYFQPKINIKTGRMIGAEALVRWQHPKRGLLNAHQFITIAEDTGVITELGEWVLRETCKTNKYWQKEGYAHITISLNLSPKQFYQEDIDQTIANVLNDTGLNPKYLELEINEQTTMQDIDLAVKQMNKIKQVGVQFSLDHFGVGYTAISYLKLFPINLIKIDRTYIKGLPSQPNDCAITNAFIALAHQLGYEALAEGVENAEQLEYLTLNHCDMVQGNYISAPIPAKKILAQLPKLSDQVIV